MDAAGGLFDRTEPSETLGNRVRPDLRGKQGPSRFTRSGLQSCRPTGEDAAALAVQYNQGAVSGHEVPMKEGATSSASPGRVTSVNWEEGTVPIRPPCRGMDERRNWP